MKGRSIAKSVARVSSRPADWASINDVTRARKTTPVISVRSHLWTGAPWSVTPRSTRVSNHTSVRSAIWASPSSTPWRSTRPYTRGSDPTLAKCVTRHSGKPQPWDTMRCVTMMPDLSSAKCVAKGKLEKKLNIFSKMIHFKIFFVGSGCHMPWRSTRDDIPVKNLSSALFVENDSSTLPVFTSTRTRTGARATKRLRSK